MTVASAAAIGVDGGDYAPAEIGAFLAEITLSGLLVERRRLQAIIRTANTLDN